MTIQYVYIIDSCSLIDLMRMNPVDIYESVWSRIELSVRRGLIISHEEVMRELAGKDDDLTAWTKRNSKMFRQLTSSQVAKVTEIQRDYPTLVDPDKDTPEADPFLIALALEDDTQRTILPTERRRIVVTEEKPKGGKVNIPFVCQKYGVECIGILEMFRREGWKF
jgi:hypothetical protein